MSTNFRFNAKAEIVCAESLGDTLAALTKELGARHAGVLVDEQVIVMEPVVQALEALGAHCRVERYPHHAIEPTTALVDAYAKALRKSTPDVLIGIGGGSTLDLCKALSVMAVHDGSVEAYHGTGRLFTKAIPKIMVPTTAGTGSEVTAGAVLVNDATKFKRAIGGPLVTPDYAVLAPELTLSMPPHVTAATGMDALGHAVESFTAQCANEVTRMYSREAFRLVANNLPLVLAEPDNLEARRQTQLGACLAGYAIYNSNTGAAHAISYALGLYHRVPHGLAIGWLLPEVVRINAEQGCELYADLWALIDGAAPTGTRRGDAEAFSEWLQGYPAREALGRELQDFDVQESQLDMLAEKGLGLKPALENNPVPFELQHSREVVGRLFARGRVL